MVPVPNLGWTTCSPPKKWGTLLLTWLFSTSPPLVTFLVQAQRISFLLDTIVAGITRCEPTGSRLRVHSQSSLNPTKTVMVNDMLDTENVEKIQRYTEDRFSVFSGTSLCETL